MPTVLEQEQTTLCYAICLPSRHSRGADHVAMELIHAAAELHESRLPRTLSPEHVLVRLQNKASVAYYLMFDNQMRMKSGAYLREELSEASDAMMQHPSGAGAQRQVRVLCSSPVRSYQGPQQLPCRVKVCLRPAL